MSSDSGQNARRRNQPLDHFCLAPTTEIELKLLCDRKYLAKVAHAPIVARYARDEGEIVDLTAVYYDTSDLDLCKAGCALRVRTDGKRFVMTFKAGKREAGKALERGEWKTAVHNMEPDFSALSRLLPVDSFAEIEHKSLQPMFRTAVRRHMRMLDTPLGMIELAVDQGQVVAGDRSEAISEIELELMSGSVEAIFLLAHELVAHFPLRPSVRSKSARGFDLALGTRPKMSKAPEIVVAKDSTLEQMFDKTLRATIEHLLQNQSAAEAGHDPDSIHQYRVALRRLRSALRLMRSVAPSARLVSFSDDAKWLMSNVGGARDWDVFVTETFPRISHTCSSVEGFDALARAAEQHRRRAHITAKKAIVARRTGQFQIAVRLWIEQAGWRADVTPESRRLLAEPARSYIAKAVRKLNRKVLKRGKGFNSLSPKGRHKVRLALKRLRDVTGFFPPSLGSKKPCRQYERRLARLQEQLGRYNDMLIAKEFVQKISKQAMPATDRRAVEALLGAAAHESDEAKLRSAWKKFRETDFRPG